MIAGLCWSLPPDVNETYYLTKAKYFWNPDWCAEDLFLQSANAHWLFYCLFGWLPNAVSLATSAWIGRIASWLFVGIALTVLTRTFIQRNWVALLTAPLVVLLNRYGHLSGEWFVGGVESKCFAYGFVFLGIAAYQARRRHLTWVCLGMASSLHVLIGGWTTLVVLCIAIWEHFFDRDTATSFSRREIAWLVAGGSIALLGIVPAILQNWNATADEYKIADQIQVYQRLAHHLYAREFAPARYLAFGLLLAFWCWQKWSNDPAQIRLLNRIVVGALLLVGIGLLLATVPQSSTWASRLLTFYWFRVADVLVPLATSLGLAVWIFHKTPVNAVWYRRALTLSLSGFVSIGVFLHAYQFRIDPRPPAAGQAMTMQMPDRKRILETHKNWKRVCRWISENTAADAVFMTPRDQQTFKWYSGRTEVANWKDMPQDARSVIVWRRRLEAMYTVPGQADFGVLAHYNDELMALARQYQASYLLVEQRFADHRRSINYPVGFEQVYPLDPTAKTTFVVYRIPDE